MTTATAADEVFATYRTLLFSIAYRMLGTVADAEDMVQETWLRWQEAQQMSSAPIRAPKSWLTTVVTRLCLDQLRSARVQREEYIGPWLPEPILSPAQDDPAEQAALTDSLSLAFLVLLERLTPVERAVFLLHDIFDYDYDTIADAVGKDAVNCRQLARRARERIAAERPRFTPVPGERERLTAQFVAACTSGDLPELVQLLTDDITLWTDSGGKALAARRQIVGADHVARFLIGVQHKIPADLVWRFDTVNNQPALIGLQEGRPTNLLALDIADGRIRGIVIVVNPDKLRTLAAQLEGEERTRQ